MSISGLASATRTNTIDKDAYGHEISLVDATRDSIETAGPSEEPEAIEPPQEPLTKKLTRDRLKGELARRKYAKWQAGRLEETNTASGDGAGDSEDDQSADREQPAAIEERGRLKRLSDKVPSKGLRQVSKSSRKRDTAIDILYENQRGLFFCGIPLYSSASLLQFDPGGWQTSTFQDSPVNITNAQVPDPSWTWDWKSWYVDMSHDVDDEGWEYSFAFGTNFAWHGSHPWFHSFVRRRRWLRKRVRIKPIRSEGRGGVQASHMLNQDYFTIHVGRDESPESRAEGAANVSSAVQAVPTTDTSDDDDGDIHNILELLKALKKAKVDRQKIALVDNFLTHGEEELHYLAENMTEVMSLLVYQTSRRHLHSKLYETLDETTRQIENSPESSHSAFQKKKEDIERAIRAIEREEDLNGGLGDPRTTDPRIQHKPSKIDTSEHGMGIDNDIKGIPESAGLSQEGIRWGSGLANTRSITSSKGKGRL